MEVITMQCFKDLTFAVSGKVKLSFGHWDCIVILFFIFYFNKSQKHHLFGTISSHRYTVFETCKWTHRHSHTHTHMCAPAHKSICSCIFMMKIDRNFQTTLKGWKGYNDRPFFFFSFFFQQRRAQWQPFFSLFFCNRKQFHEWIHKAWLRHYALKWWSK